MPKQLKYRWVEMTFWITGLSTLFFLEVGEKDHFSLCIFSHLGFTWCPGCGLGHSLYYLFHGEFYKSFKEHYFGIPAFVLIIFRLKQLLTFNQTKTI